MLNRSVAKQLAIDFCCTEEMVLDRENVFTEYKPQEGRRIFRESEFFFKAASVNGKILASGKPEIIRWARETYKDGSGAWFMDVENLRRIDEKMKEFGCHIAQAHPFYIATEKTIVDTKGYEIKKYVGDEINQFRGDNRFDEAFLFADIPKDEIGIAVMAEAEGLGIGSMLVEILKNEILDLGRIPFYGTAVSHIVSQRVALHAGFYPAWAELYCER